jgi:hypothetical protein
VDSSRRNRTEGFPLDLSIVLSFVSCLLLFSVVSLGLAWPLVSRLALDPAEKLSVAAALSLLGVFLLGWMVYAFSLPLAWFWVLPLGSCVGLLTSRGSLIQTLQDPDAASLAVGLIVVTLWSVGWLALVLN